MDNKKDITQNNAGIKMNRELVKKIKKEAKPIDNSVVKRSWEPNVNVREIGIGNPDPVLSFKEWSKNTFNKISK